MFKKILLSNILLSLALLFSQVNSQAAASYDFCKTRLKLDDCVGSIPAAFTTSNLSDMKKISCCFNSLLLDERKLYFCMKREDQVTYWKWFYDQNMQVDKQKIDQGWDEDHKICCEKALKDPKYKVGCSTANFGLDDKSDQKLQEYRICILGKLRAKGTSLRQDQNLTCYFARIYRFGIVGLAIGLIFMSGWF